jgi:hypothetical protein
MCGDYIEQTDSMFQWQKFYKDGDEHLGPQQENSWQIELSTELSSGMYCRVK